MAGCCARIWIYRFHAAAASFSGQPSGAQPNTRQIGADTAANLPPLASNKVLSLSGCSSGARRMKRRCLVASPLYAKSGNNHCKMEEKEGSLNVCRRRLVLWAAALVARCYFRARGGRARPPRASSAPHPSAAARSWRVLCAAC